MKLMQKQGQKNKIGALGEKIAENYLKKKGFTILATNYAKKWGEIDIVAHETDDRLHFVEVKTFSHETIEMLHSTYSEGTWRPEENVTREKVLKINRTLRSWLEENDQFSDADWQIDIIAVRVVVSAKYATVKYLDNIII